MAETVDKYEHRPIDRTLFPHVTPRPKSASPPKSQIKARAAELTLPWRNSFDPAEFG